MKKRKINSDNISDFNYTGKNNFIIYENSKIYTLKSTLTGDLEWYEKSIVDPHGREYTFTFKNRDYARKYIFVHKANMYFIGYCPGSNFMQYGDSACYKLNLEVREFEMLCYLD